MALFKEKNLKGKRKFEIFFALEKIQAPFDRLFDKGPFRIYSIGLLGKKFKRLPWKKIPIIHLREKINSFPPGRPPPDD